MSFFDGRFTIQAAAASGLEAVLKRELISLGYAPRGAEYGKNELSNPTRMLTSTVCIEGGIYPRMPVKTSQAIPKSLLFAAMDEIAKVRLTAPVTCGQVLIPNLLGTGADLVASRDMEAES